MASQQDFGKNIPEMFGVLPELITGGITNPQDWLSLLNTGNLATPPVEPKMAVTPQNYDQDLRNTRNPDAAAQAAFNRAVGQVGGDLEQNMIDILASSQGKARTAAGLLPTTGIQRDHPATQELIKALGTEFGVSPDAIKKEQNDLIQEPTEPVGGGAEDSWESKVDRLRTQFLDYEGSPQTGYTDEWFYQQVESILDAAEKAGTLDLYQEQESRGYHTTRKKRMGLFLTQRDERQHLSLIHI